MPVHRSKLILDSIFARLQNLPTSQDRVYLSRVYPVGGGNSLTIQRGADSIESFLSNNVIDRSFEVVVILHAQGKKDELDNSISQMALETHQALMADVSLGLDFVREINPLGESEPELSGESETPTASSEQRWQVLYRHQQTDPSN